MIKIKNLCFYNLVPELNEKTIPILGNKYSILTGYNGVGKTRLLFGIYQAIESIVKNEYSETGIPIHLENFSSNIKLSYQNTDFDIRSIKISINVKDESQLMSEISSFERIMKEDLSIQEMFYKVNKKINDQDLETVNFNKDFFIKKIYSPVI